MPVKHRTTRARRPTAVVSTPATDPAAIAEPVQQTLQPAASVDPAVAGAASEQDEIARIAYSYFEARGYEHGHDSEDWVRAEEEYRRRKAGV